MRSNKKKVLSYMFFMAVSLLAIYYFILADGIFLNTTEPTQNILEDKWFSIELNGRNTGYMHHTIKKQKWQKRMIVITCNSTSKSLPTENAEGVKIEKMTEFLETENGAPISFKHIRINNGETIIQKGTIQGIALEFIEESQDRRNIQQLNWDEKVIFPAKLRKFQKERGVKPGTKYTIKTLAPELSITRPIEMTITVIGSELLTIGGESYELTKVKTKLNDYPNIIIHTWCDKEFRMRQSEMKLGGIFLKLVEVDYMKPTKGYNTTNLTSFEGIPVKADIEKLHELKQAAQITIHMKPNANPLQIIEGSTSKIVERRKDLVVIQNKKCVNATIRSYKIPYSDKKYAKYLTDNVYMQKSSPIIQELAREAVGSEKNAYTAAIQISKFVNKKIHTKVDSGGMSTAAQTASNLVGDCTEHSVLCAAMARSIGIPSRLIVGIVPTLEGFYRYHMWTEVYVGEWLAVDATLGEDIIDALHIGITYTTLDHDEDRLLLLEKICNILGQIRFITVECL